MLRYSLEKVGWFQFEKLVQSILKAELGIGLECWGGHKDFGRDAYFEGELRYPGNINNRGTFIFQVKFSEILDSRRKVSNLKNGIKNWAESVLRDKDINISNAFFTLITNVPLSARQRNILKQKIQDEIGTTPTRTKILDGNDICALLDKHRNIRWNYPSLLNIQDLESVLNKDILEKSKVLIEEAHEIADIFVPTRAFIKTLETLEKNHFAVLEGPPEMGKTSIAYMIALNKAFDGWQVFDCRDPDDLFRVYSKSERQIFIADDAFGSTEYRADKAEDWAKELDKIMRRLDKSHWFLWTSRTHILNMALENMHLQGKAANFPKPAEIVVDVSDIDFEEKALILYKHAKAVELEDVAKEVIKQHWKEIVNNKYFTPLRIKRFTISGLKMLLQQGNNSNEELLQLIHDEIRNPTDSMIRAFNNLPQEHKTLLFSMLDVSPSFAGIPVDALNNSYRRHISGFTSRWSVNKIINHLELSFIKKTNFRGNLFVDWIHPSVRDLIINLLQEHHQERIKFIQNSQLEGILLLFSRLENNNLLLLPGDESWEILTDRIKKIITDLSIYELNRLLDILVNLRGKVSTSVLEHFKRIVWVSLERIERITYEKTELSISSDIVKKYYELLPVIYPKRPNPNWGIVWKSLINEAHKDLNSNLIIWEKIFSIETLVELFNIFNKYDPIVITALNCSRALKNILSIFMEKVEKAVGCYLDTNDSELLQEEAHGWNNVVELLEEFINLFHDQGERIENLIENAQGMASHYEFEAERIKEEEEEEEEDNVYYESEPYLIKNNAASYIEDLELLFEDL